MITWLDSSRPKPSREHALVPDGLAASSGLKLGDAVVSINETAVANATDATNKMKEANGEILVSVVTQAEPGTLRATA